MPYSITLQNINDALHHADPNAPIPPRALTRIETELEALGEFPGVIGEMLMKFRRAVTLHKMRHESGDESSILLASAHVHEVWAVLAPALERLAAGVPPKPVG